MSEPIWDKSLPTRPGWYWHRDMENDGSIQMVHVVIRGGRLQGVFHSSENIHKVYADWIELWDGEWIEASPPLIDSDHFANHKNPDMRVEGISVGALAELRNGFEP